MGITFSEELVENQIFKKNQDFRKMHSFGFSGTNKIDQALLNAHDGGIFSLCILKDGSMLSGGGRDRKIIQWDTSYNRTGAETEVGRSFPRFSALRNTTGFPRIPQRPN